MKLNFDWTLNPGHIISGLMMAIAIGGVLYTSIEKKTLDGSTMVKLQEQTLQLATTVGSLSKSVETLQGIAMLGQERLEVQSKNMNDLRGVVTDQGKQIANSREALADVRARMGLSFSDGSERK
jgi:hypothetical protein